MAPRLKAAILVMSALIGLTQAAFAQDAQIAPHRLGEPLSEWLKLNQLDLNSICEKHPRGDDSMDFKSVCKKLTSMRETGHGQFYTKDQTGRTFGWEFADRRLAKYFFDGQWHGAGDQTVQTNGPIEIESVDPKTPVSVDDDLNRCLRSGNSAVACLSLMQTNAEQVLAAQKAKASPLVETYFIDGSFTSGVVPVIEIENRGNDPSAVLVQRFSADGSLSDSSLKNVIGKTKIEVRLEGHPTNQYQGWIKVLNTKRDDVIVSGTFDLLEGNKLRQIQMISSRPEIGPLMANDEIPTDGVRRFIVINLSDYPVHVGWCQEDSPGCSPVTYDLVEPKGMRAYPIDNQKKYAGIKSTESFIHIAGVVTREKGSTRTFDSSTAIRFDPVK
jgi:hypothetical protein